MKQTTFQNHINWVKAFGSPRLSLKKPTWQWRWHVLFPPTSVLSLVFAIKFCWKGRSVLRSKDEETSISIQSVFAHVAIEFGIFICLLLHVKGTCNFLYFGILIPGWNNQHPLKVPYNALTPIWLHFLNYYPPKVAWKELHFSPQGSTKRRIVRFSGNYIVTLLHWVFGEFSDIALKS